MKNKIFPITTWTESSF